MQEIESTFNKRLKLREFLHQKRLAVIKLSHWGQGNPEVKSLLPELLIIGNSIKHLSCSLRMTNIGDFLSSSLLSNIINLSWGIMLSHLSVRELPVSLIFCWETSMARAVLSSSLVAEPHIVSSSHQLEGWSYFIVVHDPAISRVGDSMLKENYRSSWLDIFTSDPEDIQDITIIGGNWMGFKPKAVLCNNFLEWLIEIRALDSEWLEVKGLELKSHIQGTHHEILRLRLYHHLLWWIVTWVNRGLIKHLYI